MKQRLGAVCLALLLLSSACLAQQAATGTTYTDGAGSKHTWSVTAAHSLTWDGHAYIPVGANFSPRSLSASPTEEDWQRDVASLDALKTHGVTDLIVRPRGSVTEIPTATWQRLITKLEQGGFTYGIAFGVGVPARLTGTVVHPAGFRSLTVEPGHDVTWNVPGCDTGLVALVNGDDGADVYRLGRVRADNGAVTITADMAVPQGTVALLYPHQSVKVSSDGYLPDLWGGFDSYRDDLLATFGKVKFGPGLRFFLDPLASPLAVTDEVANLIPDSPGWRLEWEAFLSRKYANLEELIGQWGIVDNDVTTFRDASNLLPLFNAGKGIPFYLNTVTNKRVQVTGSGARFWADLHAFQDETLATYMDAAANLLKREVANVPVVYTHRAGQRFATLTAPSCAIDGLGVVAYGTGTALVTGGADATYSQCREATRPLWCVVTETADVANAAGVRPSYTSQQGLTYDLDWLRGIGAKGFFLQAFVNLADASPSEWATARVPEQLDWVHAYAARIGSEAGMAASQPRTLSFPSVAAGIVHSGPIGTGGVWWVPSLSTGKVLEFGTSYVGYTIASAEGELTVLWSLTGPRETHLLVSDPKAVKVTTPDGQPILCKIDAKRRTLALMIDATPVVLHASGDSVFPMEALDDAMRQLNGLIKSADDAKIPVHEFHYQLDRIEVSERRKDYTVAYANAIQALNGIIGVLQPFSWREAENATQQTFTEVAKEPAASGGRVLLLNTEAPAPREGYAAQYSLSVPVEDTYTVWVSCTPLGGQASPFLWLMDTGDTHTSNEAEAVGEPYLGDQFRWYRLGRATLRKGSHTLTLRVTDRAAALKRYHLVLDAVLVTRTAFTPNGINKPSLNDLPAIAGSRPATKEGKGKAVRPDTAPPSTTVPTRDPAINPAK